MTKRLGFIQADCFSDNPVENWYLPLVLGNKDSENESMDSPQVMGVLELSVILPLCDLFVLLFVGDIPEPQVLPSASRRLHVSWSPTDAGGHWRRT